MIMVVVVAAVVVMVILIMITIILALLVFWWCFNSSFYDNSLFEYCSIGQTAEWLQAGPISWVDDRKRLGLQESNLTVHFNKILLKSILKIQYKIVFSILKIEISFQKTILPVTANKTVTGSCPIDYTVSSLISTSPIWCYYTSARDRDKMMRFMYRMREADITLPSGVPTVELL